MAGPTNSESMFTYVNLYKGKFTIRVHETDPRPEVITRTTKEGKVIHEIPYGKLENMILADIREASHEQYGNSWEFIMLANNKYYLLRVGKNNPVSTMILNRLENIILTDEFTLSAWQPTGEEKTVVVLWQYDKQIERVYTKDNPGSLPPPVKVKVNEVDTWDWTDQLVYWSELVKSLKPSMIGVNTSEAQVAQEQSTTDPKPTSGPAHGETKKPSSPPTTPEDETDDLPF